MKIIFAFAPGQIVASYGLCHQPAPAGDSGQLNRLSDFQVEEHVHFCQPAG